MNHWNYRMTRESNVDSESGYVYAVREVYYEDDEPKGWTKDPVYPTGETHEDALADLKHYAEALTKPVLDLDTRTWIEP